jgi:hypothetical protein
MTTVRIKPIDVPGELRRIAKGSEKAILSACYRTAEVDAIRAIQASIRGKGIANLPKGRSASARFARARGTPIDTEDYLNSWRATRLRRGAIVYSVSNPRVKAGVIEKGRRPAWIPIQPLAEWVRRKLGIADTKKARSVAFAIAKTAKKYPRPGLRVVERARPDISAALKRNVEAALTRLHARQSPKRD